jgi:hypothetical protein
LEKNTRRNMMTMGNCCTAKTGLGIRKVDVHILNTIKPLCIPMILE